MPLRITILGDSSSSGIGLGEACYPAKLPFHLQDYTPVAITNCAVPGFTSADASRFFHTEVSHQSPDYVIVYLGNNEGASSRPKGYYSPFRARLAACCAAPPVRQFRPVLSRARFQFQHEVPPVTVAATTPDQFRRNVRSIVRCTVKRGGRAIIINPVANHLYPCGLGAPNSAYFCYLDKLDQLGYAPNYDVLDEASGRLASGIEYYLSGRWENARSAWEPLTSMQSVAGFVARHNLACAQARMGNIRAGHELEALLGEHACYDSTVLYNLAQFKEAQGNKSQAKELSKLALERDTSLYRVKQEYREAVASLSSVKGASVLDLEPLVRPSHFIDYCHPTDEGHDEIARALANLIRSEVSSGCRSEISSYDLVLPTPDYFNNPRQTLLDYYCVDWPIERERIARLMDAINGGGHRVGENEIELANCLQSFLDTNRRHPLFTASIDLLDAWAPRSHEILSFPEFFQYRILYNYLLAYEESTLPTRLTAGRRLEQFRFSANDYKKLILCEDSDALATEINTRPEYYSHVMENVWRRLVSAKQMFRVKIGERIRTIMTWYTRESFRYGTQSRMSMLYARWDIERLLEGLIVASVVANRLGANSDLQTIDRLLSRLVDLLCIHEEYIQRYHYDPENFSALDYEIALRKSQESVDCLLH